jgi:hypothetical protein
MRTATAALLMAVLILSAGCAPIARNPVPVTAGPAAQQPAAKQPAQEQPTGLPPVQQPSAEQPSTQPPTAAAPQPQPAEVAFFAPADLITGRTAPVQTYRLPDATGSLAFSPDGKTVLAYTGDPFGPASAPALIDLATGQLTPLAVPDPSAWFGHAEWLSDEEFMLLGGGQALFGSVRTPEQLTSVPVDYFVWSASRSPDGRALALWGPLAEGKIAVLDLPTRKTRLLPGPFRVHADDASLSLSWSPDGKRLAGMDCERRDGGPSCRIRIIDAATGETVRTIGPGLGLIAWLPGGRLLGWRAGGTGEAAIDAVFLSEDGKELGSLKYGQPSPDGRYLLQQDYKLNFTLRDLTTGATAGWTAPGYPSWTPDGHLRVITPLN